MTLGIAIKNDHGIAIGADSLVSHPGVSIDIQRMLDIITERYDDTPDKYELMKMLVMAGKGRVIKSHHSRKIHPMYRRDGRYYGALICSGDGIIADLQRRIIEELDHDGTTRSFHQYVKELNRRTKKRFPPIEDISTDNTAFIYVGVCGSTNKYAAYETRITIKRSAKTGKQVVTMDSKDKANEFLMSVGDSSVVDTLLTGSSNVFDLLVDKHLKVLSTILAQDLAEDKVVPIDAARNILTRAASLLAEPEPVNQGVLTAILSAVEQNAEEGGISSGNFIDVLFTLELQSLRVALGHGKDIGHFSRMTLRELLKVIGFLIETTMCVHEYINDEIPTVGGDIYYATITRDEGLVFRNLADSF